MTLRWRMIDRWIKIGRSEKDGDSSYPTGKHMVRPELMSNRPGLMSDCTNTIDAFEIRVNNFKCHRIMFTHQAKNSRVAAVDRWSKDEFSNIEYKNTLNKNGRAY